MKSIELESVIYTELEIGWIKDIEGLSEKIKNIKNKFNSDGGCVANSYLVAKATGAKCVEGFVICESPSGYPGAIRHCWNRLGNVDFDVTKEFIWPNILKEVTHFYFELGVFCASEYNPEQHNVVNLKFISDAIAIAAKVNGKVNSEAKENSKI